MNLIFLLKGSIPLKGSKMGMATVTEPASQNLQETYLEISRQAEHLLDAEYSTILLEQNGVFQRVFASHPIIARTKVRKRGRTYKAFHDGKTHIYSIHSKKDIHPQQYVLNVKSIVFIPLIWKKKKMG